MEKNVNYMSLYAKLRDGRYRAEFPEGWFPEVTFCNNQPTISTARWKKINYLEGVYEWTIFCTKNFDIIQDYLNGASMFYPDWYMLRFRSVQNSLRDIMYDSIYDLSSDKYSPLNINKENGQRALNPVQSYKDDPMEKFSLKPSRGISAVEDSNIQTFIVPISMSVDDDGEFAIILNKVRKNEIKLPIIT